MSKLQSFAATLLKPFAGKTQFQTVFFNLYKLSLHGMNFNKGGDVYISGEASALNFIKRKIARKDMIVFDVGANVGEYSEFLLSELGPNTEIFCIEPMPKSFEVLQQTFSNNDNVKPFNIGFSESLSTAPMYSTNESSTMASLHDRQLNHIGIKMEKFSEVELEPIDYFCRTHNIDRIDFLKLDVEGHEFSALSGAQEFLANKKIKFIQFEMGGTSIDAKIFFRDFWFLLNDNYKIYRILQNGLYEITEYKENCEIFQNMNYLAELKT